MKEKIDELVGRIHFALQRPAPAMPELATCLRGLGVDGHAQAIGLREVLARWVEDEGLSREVREYAQQKLDGLPAF